MLQTQPPKTEPLSKKKAELVSNAHTWSALWCWYLGLPLDAFTPREHQEIAELCADRLRPVPERIGTQLARRYSDQILRKFPYEVRLALTSALKRFRNPQKKLLLSRPADWELLQLYCRHMSKARTSPFRWKGKKAAICLSHDVDNRGGYDFVSEMVSRQKQVGLKGTFNFVTSYDYAISPELIHEIESNGFEAGLHCLTHDIGLAYRGKKKIYETLSKALKRFPGKPRGYRSAALSISPDLLEVVSQLGLVYDSTIQLSNPVYHCAEWPFPFFVENAGLWEIPLTLQDDIFLRDASISIEQSIKEVRLVLEAIIEVGGVFVMILHPHLMATHQAFYQALLNLFCEYKEDALFATTGEVFDIASEAYANYLGHLK